MKKEKNKKTDLKMDASKDKLFLKKKKPCIVLDDFKKEDKKVAVRRKKKSIKEKSQLDIIASISQVSLDATDSLLILESKKRGRRKKIVPDEIVPVAKIEKRKEQCKATKKKTRKKTVDINKKTDMIIFEEKKAIIQEKTDIEYEDLKAGRKRKRKRKLKQEPPVYPDCTFKDSMSIPYGDARIAFNDGTDTEVPPVIWCPKKEQRLMQRLCSIYVSNRCQRKIKCEYFEYGMSIKFKFGVKEYIDPEPKKIKIKENDELQLEEELESD